ncbi:MAG: DUF418 domain-containing protein [Acidobacteriota bacterium]
MTEAIHEPSEDHPAASDAAAETGAQERAEPVQRGERIRSLDLLRGVAVMGILVMNIQSYSMPQAAYFNPTAYGDLTGLNYAVWVFSHVLADQKFMSLFSLLFGAGLVLVAQRVEARGGSPWKIHGRRMLWLLVFGLIHAYVIWAGDILVTYALCGLLVFPLRRRSPRTLLIVGALVLMVPVILNVLSAFSIPHWPAESLDSTGQRWAPPPQEIESELEAMRGNWLEQAPARNDDAFQLQVPAFLFWTMWRAGGLMLIGMALFKLGVLSAARSRRFYRGLALVGLAVGVPLAAWGVVKNFEAGWAWQWSMFFGSLPNYFASLFTAAAYLGIIVGAAAVFPGRRLFQAAGRMAFTNYLGQSVICTLIFYGTGLGWFGSVERSGQALVVVLVLLFQLVFSAWWLERFRFGPAEWLWRSLTYGRLQPMRRRD